MKIKSIKVSRIPNRAIVYFDTGIFLPVSIDDVYQLHLTPGLEIDLVDYSLKYLLYNYALNQIALSPKLPAYLTQKLKIKYLYYSKKYQISSAHQLETINQIVSLLQSKNLLNEQDYVESIIRRFSHKPIRYLEQLLRSKGINPGQYHHLLVGNDSQLLKKILATKKFKDIKNADFNTKRKLLSSLIRKGFAYNDIKSEIDYSPSD